MHPSSALREHFQKLTTCRPSPAAFPHSARRPSSSLQAPLSQPRPNTLSAFCLIHGPPFDALQHQSDPWCSANHFSPTTHCLTAAMTGKTTASVACPNHPCRLQALGNANESRQKANLARIRDNQRRSRARRKEYLQELETKWRVCEQMGIEASSEMQTAARKVLDENKKLRILLNQKGVSNDEIDAFASSASSSTPNSPGPHDLPSPLPSVSLAKLLSSRRAVSSTPMSRRQQSEEVPPPPPMQLPTPQLQTAQLTPLMSMSALSPSPGSVTSSVSTPTTILSPETFPAVHIPRAPSSDPGGEHYSPHHSFEYGHQSYTSNIDPSSWQPYQNPNGVTSVPVTSYPDFGYTSCVDAANIIRSMKDDATVNLENALGCDIPGTDSQMDNTRVYTVMDKYNPSMSPWG